MINNQNRPHLGLPTQGSTSPTEDRAIHAIQSQAGMAAARMHSLSGRLTANNAAERSAYTSLSSSLLRDVSAIVHSAQRLLSSPALTPNAAGDVARALSMLVSAAQESDKSHGSQNQLLPARLRDDLTRVSQQASARAQKSQAPQAPGKLRRSGKERDLKGRAAPLAPQVQSDRLATLEDRHPVTYEPLARQQAADAARGPQLKRSNAKAKGLVKPLQRLAAKLAIAGRMMAGKTSLRKEPLITPFLMQPPPQPELHPQVKQKRSYHEYAHLPFASGSDKQRFSRIIGASGNDYVMTWTQKRGGFGKVRWGFTPAGQDVAIKEIRHTPKAGRGITGAPKTHAVARADAVDEAKQTVKLRRSIENYVKYFDDLPSNAAESFKNVRTGVQPFELHDVILDDTEKGSKTYIVMSRETGDVLQLRTKIRTELRGPAALSLAAQGFTELAGMHEVAHHMHCDLRLENVFFNGKGQMKLMDFGLSQRINRNGVGPLRGPNGSISAPEAVSYGPNNVDYPNLSTATDVYAMGVIIAEMAQQSNRVINPFHVGFLMPGYTEAQSHASYQHMFHLFEQWKVELMAPNGRVDVRRIDGSKRTYFDQFFADLARSNPALCDMVLNDAMVTEVAKRLPARALAARARQLTAVDKDGLASLRRNMSRMEAQSDALNFRGNAMAYDAFDRAQTVADVDRSSTRKKFRDLNI